MAIVKTEREIEKIRVAGRILGRTLRALIHETRPGVTGKELDKIAKQLIIGSGGEPAFLHYQPDGASTPFPATLCVSLNDVVVHGVPTDVPFTPRDLVKLDLGVKYQGYHADAAVTVSLGPISPLARRLVAATEDALAAAIRVARVGNTLGDIGFAIKSEATKKHFSILDGLTGHGVGKKLHEDPIVWNEGVKGKGMPLLAGMVLAIEPMASIGTRKIKQLSDESYATMDGSLSAHFEHTILITSDGAEILTAI